MRMMTQTCPTLAEAAVYDVLCVTDLGELTFSADAGACALA
jgi:hypothetical protein